MTDKAVADLDKALGIWFPPGQPAQSAFSESDIKDIVDTLRRHKQESWSRIPRIYITLRLAGHLDVIDIFLDTGTSDISFPFTPQTLPGTLKDVTARSDFIEKQVSVLTKGLDLEKEHGKHRHLASTEDTPFEKIQELGKGGYGYVDRVRSNVSYREYARKLIPRGRTFRKDKAVLRDFERELAMLKKLTHHHIVELVGSYTDPKYVGLIMSPVADRNLDDFLDRDYIPPEDLSFLRTFYGCLARALRYLHGNQIRHKDIKSQNVLVKGHHVYLADFGLSLDWSEIGASTTTGPSSKTLRYCAPEVAANQSRNSASDLWSLGCVFLEIWTTLRGDAVADLMEYLAANGTGSTCYYANEEAVSSWIQRHHKHDSIDAKLPNPWIQSMLHRSHTERCTVAVLCDWIAKANRNPAVRVSFMGRCCSEDEESAESVCSTDIDLTDGGEGAEYLPIKQVKQVVDHSATSVHPAATSQGIMTECLPELEADPPSKLQEEESQPEQSMPVASTGMQAHCSHDIDHNGLEPEHMIETGHIDPILSGSLLYKPLWAGQSPTKYESKYFWFAEHPFWPPQLTEIRNTKSERTLKAIAWSTQTNTGVLCF
ncbi:kinase-like domain-containing protein [Paraphoma chrysanthemicola]|nr:kinase-like domain-containing protein [Paraphoma chrysanthemicola]